MNKIITNENYIENALRSDAEVIECKHGSVVARRGMLTKEQAEAYAEAAAKSIRAALGQAEPQKNNQTADNSVSQNGCSSNADS